MFRRPHQIGCRFDTRSFGFRLYGGLGLLALLFTSQSVWSMAVSPSPSWNGNYTVTWNSWWATGCTYNYVPPEYYLCYWLEEKIGSGNWTSVSTPIQSTSWTGSGKPPNTYEYRVMYEYGDWAGSYADVADGPVSVQVGPDSDPLPLSEQQEYATRHGDLDGDGDIDIYVKRVAGNSWQLPIEELILRQNSNGTFNVETSVSPADMNTVNQWGISLTLPKLVDFNADGLMDILITGLEVANVGPHDVVVFASDASGAPPPSARLMDESIQQFAMDLMAYLTDPNYFSGAYQYHCTVYWIIVPGDQWDIDGYVHYIGIPWPIVYCDVEINPNFSPPAVAVGWNLASIFQAGEIGIGNQPASTIAQQLEQLFGSAYMGGVLQFGGYLPIEVAEELEKVKMEVRRAQRVLAGFFQIFQWLEGEDVPAGPHSYSVTTTICPITWDACTLDHVFFKMLQLPTFGHSDACGNVARSQCAIPIQDDDEMFVDVIEWPGTADDVGPITVTVDAQSYTHQNITEAGHLFHEGTVTRTAYIENGEIKIVTTGTGTGPYAEMNEIAGPAVFKLIDSEITDRIAKEELQGIIIP